MQLLLSDRLILLEGYPIGKPGSGETSEEIAQVRFFINAFIQAQIKNSSDRSQKDLMREFLFNA